MKIKHLIIGTLVAAALASCDKRSDSAKTSDKAKSPVPATSVKESGTANSVVEDVPMSKANADTSPTPK